PSSHTTHSQLYPLSLHDALPICRGDVAGNAHARIANGMAQQTIGCCPFDQQRAPAFGVASGAGERLRDTVPDDLEDWRGLGRPLDRKSTRLNSSHQIISYAVFCL